MEGIVLADKDSIDRKVRRLAHEIMESHNKLENGNKLALAAIQTGGNPIAEYLKELLEEFYDVEPTIIGINTIYSADNYQDIIQPAAATEFNLSQSEIDGNAIYLVDDVTRTGRSLVAAMNRINYFGRPSRIRTVSLVDIIVPKDLPVYLNHVGINVNPSDYSFKDIWVEANLSEISVNEK